MLPRLTRGQPSTSAVEQAEQRLNPLPAITPSSSSSSVALQNPDSPFSSLISRLLSTQDELLSSRADQKTLLLSLVANLRAELAAREHALDTVEQQKASAFVQLRQAAEERKRDRKQHEQQLHDALEQMETAKNVLSGEIIRRENALREEALHERIRRELAESQLEQLKRRDLQVGEIEQMNLRVQDLKTANDTLETAKRQLQSDLLVMQTREITQAEEIQAMGASLQEAHSTIHRCEEQLAAAQMQITRAAARHEQQVIVLKDGLDEAQARSEELKAQLADARHAVEHERFEHTRQADYTASIQEDLRQEHDNLKQSISRLEQHRDTTQRELVAMKTDSTRLLQLRDTRISELEADILHRSAERKRHAAEVCSSCQEAEVRTSYLEQEIIRMREQAGRMRMESADREVKVARLTKARDQLQEDIQGLNIALEAKQQEVHLLKRASIEIPGTARRGGRSRPSSIHEATTKLSISTRRRPDDRRFSVHNASALETPSVAANVLASATTGARPSNVLGARYPLSRGEDKALEAASLVPVSGQDKENVRVGLEAKVVDLPAAPQHPLQAILQKRQALLV